MFILVTWVAAGGRGRQRRHPDHTGLIGHAGLATVGLALWVLHVSTGAGVYG